MCFGNSSVSSEAGVESTNTPWTRRLHSRTTHLQLFLFSFGHYVSFVQAASCLPSADADLLDDTLPQAVPHLILVDGWIPVLRAQVRRDKVVNFLPQVLIGGLWGRTGTQESERGPYWSNAELKTEHCSVSRVRDWTNSCKMIKHTYH